MIWNIISSPGWFPGRHFYHGAPHAPHITTATITLTTQYLPKYTVIKISSIKQLGPWWLTVPWFARKCIIFFNYFQIQAYALSTPHVIIFFSHIFKVIHFLGSCFHLWARRDIPSLRCPLTLFLTSWPWPLTYDLDLLDIISLDLHAKIQVCMSIHSAGIARRTDGHTHRHTMSKLLHLTHHRRGVKKVKWAHGQYEPVFY